MTPNDNTEQTDKNLAELETQDNLQQVDLGINNLEGDRWEDTEEGMRYYGAEYDPMLDEYS